MKITLLLVLYFSLVALSTLLLKFGLALLRTRSYRLSGMKDTILGRVHVPAGDESSFHMGMVYNPKEKRLEPTASLNVEALERLLRK